MEIVKSVLMERPEGRSCLLYDLMTERVMAWLLMVVGTIGKTVSE